jgi:hypothetical protein
VTTDIAALIAEAREAVLSMDYERAYQGTLVDRLADALEAAHAEPEFDEPCNCASLSNPAQTEPDDDEREAHQWLANYHGSIDSTALVLAFQAGRRSSRVPVSQDELAAAWKEGAKAVVDLMGIEMVPLNDGETFPDRPVNPYIFPKADRKPDDSDE